MTDAHEWASGIKRTLRRRGPSGPRVERKQILILPAETNCLTKGTHPRKWGTGEKVTMSARRAKALIGAVPRQRFAYFAAVGKVGRPTGRNMKKVGAT